MGRNKGVIVRKVRDLERLRDQGRVQRVGQRWTLEAWLEHWLENIARPDLRPNSYAAYRTAVQKHLIPRAGKHRLDRLELEHLELLCGQMIMEVARPATAHQVHQGSLAPSSPGRQWMCLRRREDDRVLLRRETAGAVHDLVQPTARRTDTLLASYI
jgi:Phage integrase, N-terminal SAM-like domain